MSLQPAGQLDADCREPRQSWPQTFPATWARTCCSSSASHPSCPFPPLLRNTQDTALPSTNKGCALQRFPLVRPHEPRAEMGQVALWKGCTRGASCSLRQHRGNPRVWDACILACPDKSGLLPLAAVPHYPCITLRHLCCVDELLGPHGHATCVSVLWGSTQLANSTLGRKNHSITTA